MNVLVVGYDRMGAHLVSQLAKAGHAVTALDYQTSPNDPLINEKGVHIVPGSESLIADIRNIGTATIDAALALSDDDSRNAMAAQIAVHIFHIPEVVCRIEDPERGRLYRNLGLGVISPTQLMTDTIVSGTFEQADYGTNRAEGVTTHVHHHRGMRQGGAPADEGLAGHGQRGASDR